MYDLHRLRLLRELKFRGTLAAVAKTLSYSPSSISQQLSLLEAEAGVPLLEPVGRGVRLTTQAEILVAHTDVILQRLEQAEADLATSVDDLVGIVRIAAFQTVAFTLLPAALTVLQQRHPRLSVHIGCVEAEQALPALLARDFDLVVAEEYPGNPYARLAGLDCEELRDDRLKLALPPDTACTNQEAQRGLAGRPWVMEPEHTMARQWAVTVCRNAGFEPDVRFESTDLLFHVRLVEQGHAVAFLPDLVWASTPLTVTLRPLPGGPQARRLFTAARNGSGQHPAVLACRRALAEAAPPQAIGTHIL